MAHCFESTGYLVSRVRGAWFRECRVPGFESTGYLVSRVGGTWFQEYRVPGFESTGYTVPVVLGYRVRVHSFLLPLGSRCFGSGVGRLSIAPPNSCRCLPTETTHKLN